MGLDARDADEAGWAKLRRISDEKFPDFLKQDPKAVEKAVEKIKQAIITRGEVWCLETSVYFLQEALKTDLALNPNLLTKARVYLKDIHNPMLAQELLSLTDEKGVDFSQECQFTLGLHYISKTILKVVALPEDQPWMRALLFSMNAVPNPIYIGDLLELKLT